MTGDGYSLYELGWDDGYEALKQSRIAENFPHHDEYPDYRRGFWDGMKAAKKEIEAAGEGSAVPPS